MGKETIDEAKSKAVAERVITRAASERVARTAFLQAKLRYLQAQDAAEHQQRFSGPALTLRCVALSCLLVGICLSLCVIRAVLEISELNRLVYCS